MALRRFQQHFDAIVRVDSAVLRVRLPRALSLYDARIEARNRDLAPIAIEQVVDGQTVARVEA
jgi:hypothetical protein